MQVITYLSFNGRCREAFEFYAEVLRGKIESIFPHAGTPAEQYVPAEWRDKIMHARLSVGNEVLMGADAPPEHYKQPQGFSVNLSLNDETEAKRIFAALSENGRITLPLAPTFWAKQFGMFVDRFGIPWMINCE
jgi:PhnB protein